jgi:hypothetical protein
MKLRPLVITLAALACFAPCADSTARADETQAEETKDKWAEHRGDLPFVVGYEKGMAQVKMTGKPPMYFFTTTW